MNHTARIRLIRAAKFCMDFSVLSRYNEEKRRNRHV